VAQEVEYPAEVDDQGPGSVSGQIPEIYFCPDLQGYGWCFRKGGYLNIGLGRVDPSGLTQHVSQFCEFLRQRGKLRGEIPVAWAGHAYQLYHRVQPRLYDEGILLVGDAAGLAYPASGEGIRPAVESGIIAAEVIVTAGGSTAEQLARYEDHIVTRFGPPRRSGAAGWLPAAWLHHVAARLLANRWFIRRVVMDGWFLHRHQPALTTGSCPS
jgi:flavin-dependent dehydrogenase